MFRALPFTLVLALGSGCVIHTTGHSTVHVQDHYVAPSYVMVSAPPPPLVAAVSPGLKPSPDSIWIEGYWDWQGSGWVWIEGHWETRRPGYEWEHGVCVVVEGGGYQYHPGHWRPSHVAPPPVYRAEGTVQVHVGPSVVHRVPPSEIHHSTVVVAPGAHHGPSANVIVRPRPATVVVQPSQPTVVVQPSQPTVVVQPSQPTVVVQPSQPTVVVQPNRPTTVTVQPSQPTVTVQPSRPTTTVTVQPEPRPTVVQPSRPTTTVTVQPAQPVQPVRPSTTVTVQPATVAPNTTVRPSVQAQPATVAPNTTVRPSVQAQPATVAPNTTVRPAQPTTMATIPGATVQPTNPVVTTPRPTMPQAHVQCAPTLSRVPQGGFLVLRGSGLGGATAVTIGSQTAAIATRTNDEVRARLVGVSSGGAVSVTVDGQTYSCGRVDIVGP
jgi:hypothetical protein